MAVVTRYLKDRTPVFWVVTKGHAERSGLDRRAAERLDARRKKEVKNGTYSPIGSVGISIGKYLSGWLDERKGRSIRVERSYLENHVLKREWFCSIRMDDAAPKHIQKLIEEIRGEAKISHKTIQNIFTVLSSAFSSAERKDITKRRVCMLDPKTLSPKSEVKTPYSVAEIKALLASAKGPRLVWIALAVYTGMRCGEVCGRRWSDWQTDPEPLGALQIATQYADKPLKTDAPRVAPVLPELAAVLAWWKREGFELYFKRKPRQGDFIVPRMDDPTDCLSHNSAYAHWARDCKRAGIENRTQHGMRHAFVTLLRRGKADVSVVKQITHKPKGEIVDVYTHRDWAELCEAALCLPSFIDPGHEPKSGLGALLERETSMNHAGEGSATGYEITSNKRENKKSAQFGEALNRPESSGPVISGAGLDARQEIDPDARAFRDALAEHTADVRRGVKKTTAPYVARSRKAGSR